MPVSRSRSALRIISPAPASRISASAICAVTSTPRASTQRGAAFRLPFFRASTGRSSDACAAGSSDTSMAVSSATPPVNTSVIASRPIIDAPMRVSPDAPAILGVLGRPPSGRTRRLGHDRRCGAEQRERDEHSAGRAEHRQHDPRTAARSVRGWRQSRRGRQPRGAGPSPWRRRDSSDSRTRSAARSRPRRAAQRRGGRRHRRATYMELRAFHPGHADVLARMRGVDLTAEDSPRTRPFADTSRLRRATIVTNATAPGQLRWLEGGERHPDVAVPIRRGSLAAARRSRYGAALMRIVRPTTAGSPPKRASTSRG